MKFQVRHTARYLLSAVVVAGALAAPTTALADPLPPQDPSKCNIEQYPQGCVPTPEDSLPCWQQYPGMPEYNCPVDPNEPFDPQPKPEFESLPLSAAYDYYDGCGSEVDERRPSLQSTTSISSSDSEDDEAARTRNKSLSISMR